MNGDDWRHAERRVVITREELAGHIDDPICTCYRCKPEWHTGIRCSCPYCKAIRQADGGEIL